MDLSHITVLIPAHNRPDRLKRLLGYYAKTNIRVLVADSSAERFLYAADYPEIQYRHFPKEQFLNKVYEVLPLIDTRYVVFCADDDFIVPKAIGEIALFLDEQPDYATAQGHFLTFEKERDGTIEFYPRYIRNFDKKMDAATGRGRLEQYEGLYASMLYGVCRSDIFKEMYRAIVAQSGELYFRNLYLAEEYYNMYTLIRGKHATLPVFYAAREFIKGSAASTTVPFEVIARSLEHRQEYEGFMDILSTILASVDGISKEESLSFLEGMIEKKLNPKVSFKNKLIHFGMKCSWGQSYFLNRYKAKGEKAVEGMKSYPYNTISPEKQGIIDAIRGQNLA